MALYNLTNWRQILFPI